MKLLWNALYGNGWYKQKNVWAIKTIIGNDGILLLNEKHETRIRPEKICKRL